MFDSDLVINLIVIIPIISFVINVTFVRIFLGSKSNLSSFITILGIALSFILSFLALMHVISNGAEAYEPREWINFGSFSIEFGVILDQLTAIMLVVVSGISLLVQIYSIGYMKKDVSFVRYFAYMSLFTASMLGLVISRNLIQIFVFWELVGVSSYLLIGFWMNRPSAAAAAKKAFLMTRFGDFGFLFGIMYIASKNHEWLDVPTLYNAASAELITGSVATIFSLSILAGAIGKSAQFPLHSWLPDAMEGPTSVSALIHSATMVTAGVFLLARLFPIISLSSDVLILIAIIGGFTVVFAASMGLVSNDIKRVLAYSTVSQLGYMMLGLGIGAYGPAIFHLFTHAFFKASLFLGSGSLHHSTGTFNLKYMGGMRKIMPYTYWSMIIGSLSLAGIFPLSGFWSKDEIIASILKSDFEFGIELFLLILALIGVLMTSFYMFRAIFLAFHGDFRGGGDQEMKYLKEKKLYIPETIEKHHKSEAPKIMYFPVLVLAFFAIFVGFFTNPIIEIFVVSKHWFSDFLYSNKLIFPEGLHSIKFNISIALISTILAGSGILLSWMIYIKKVDQIRNRIKILERLNNVISKKYYIDEIYEEYLVRKLLHNGLFKITEIFDLKVVDKINSYLATLTIRIGGILSSGQNGYTQLYVGSMILGLMLLASGLVLLR